MEQGIKEIPDLIGHIYYFTRVEDRRAFYLRWAAIFISFTRAPSAGSVPASRVW